MANRELGTIESIEAGGQTRVRLDSGRHVAIAPGEPHHLDHGYAVTSHSSQGQTADRVLVHVDTERGERLVNQRLAYVAISRGRYDADLYTNDAATLADALGRHVSDRSALEPGTVSATAADRSESHVPQRRPAEQSLAPTPDA